MLLNVAYLALVVALISGVLGFAVLKGRRRGAARATFWTALAVAAVCGFFGFFSQPPP